MSELGFLGLGTMGSAMALRLVDAGHTVRVWNRSAEGADALVAAGAVRVATPADALAAPVSFSMLANDDACDAVFTADAVTAGALHVNMATISAAAAVRLAELFASRGGRYLAAPVLGRPPVAAAGKLNIIAGGHADALAQARPFLELLGQRIWPVGDEPRTANVVKIAVNYNILHALLAIGESVALVERHGVEPEAFAELLTSTLFGGMSYTAYADIIAQRRYLPAGFTAELGLKDLGLAEEAAREAHLTLPTAPVLRSLYGEAVADPALRESDWAVIAELLRR